jgi:murein DD-endopeptidase MepM/ murein hydrolase activator NlpD
MSYLEKHHDAIENANTATVAACQRAEASNKAMEKAAAKVKKQEKRIKKLRANFKKLSAAAVKKNKARKSLDKALGAGSLDELRALLGSYESLSEEQVALLEKLQPAYEKLQALQLALEEKAAQAEADAAAFEQAKDESDKVDAKPAKKIGALVNDVADDGARRALGDSIAKSVFPEKRKLACPCPDTRVEDWFGYRDFDAAVHKGIDYAANEGEPYYATANGIVIYATDDDGYNGGAGNWIVIAHGDGVVSKYMHSQRVFVQVGDIVLQGQHIANAGQTGAAYGPHLHFQVEVDGEAVDPVPLMK